MKIKNTCQSCGKDTYIESFPLINVKDSPLMKEMVKKGSLFAWKCDACAKVNIAKYQTIYHDPELKLLFWLLPSEQIDEKSFNSLEDILYKQFVENGFGGEREGEYVLRRVESSGSLVEKVNIFDANLDDKVIEICKYVTKLELIEKESSLEMQNKIKDFAFKFYGLDGADNEIIFSYPFDNQMQMLKIGFNIYEDCCGILQRNPKLKPKTGFSLIDSSWIAENFA